MYRHHIHKLVLLRHGESIWNKKNIFTGWTDIDLSKQGILEAHRAGKILKRNNFVFDIAYTSVLKRAIRTLWIVLDEMDLMWIPVMKSWRLNERHYGALQGLNKTKTARKYGAEQVFRWRRGYKIKPPELSESDIRHPINDPRYKNLKRSQVPSSESLEDTLKRVLPYWKKKIVPTIKTGKTILISAHGNSLRALIKYLDNISDEKISNLNIPMGVPIVYELNNLLKPIKHYYLGNKKDIEKVLKKHEPINYQNYLVK